MRYFNYIYIYISLYPNYIILFSRIIFLFNNFYFILNRVVKRDIPVGG